MKRNIYFSFVTCSFGLFLLRSCICSNAFAGSVDDFFADVDKAKTESSAAKSPVPAKEYDSGDTLKTLRGVVYKNYKVTRTEPDGITISHSKGIAKILFPDLPSEFAKKYNYDSQAADEYARETAANRATYAEEQKRDAKELEIVQAKADNDAYFNIARAGGCDSCKSTGFCNFSRCNGTGYYYEAAYGKQQMCPRCKGTGKCPTCRGTGGRGDNSNSRYYHFKRNSEAAEMREWTSKSGTILTARLAACDGENVQFKKSDGSKVQIGIDMLSEGDTDYVKTQFQILVNNSERLRQERAVRSSYGGGARFNTSSAAYAYMSQLNANNQGGLDAIREGGVSGVYQVDAAQYRVIFDENDGMFWVIPR